MNGPRFNAKDLRDIRRHERARAYLNYRDQIDDINRKFAGPDSGEIYVAKLVNPESIEIEHTAETRNDGIYKIGMSRNPPDRIRSFNRFSVTMPIEVVYAAGFWTGDMREAERMLHQAFAPFRVRGEWFNLPGQMFLYLYATWYFDNGEFYDLEGDIVYFDEVVSDYFAAFEDGEDS